MWNLFDHDFEVTLVNLPASVSNIQGMANLSVLPGDACDLSGVVADEQYDVAFSNSTIEHVGGPERQAAFADSVRRVARAYWVQTPSSRFPVEAHCGVPFYWQLPRRLRERLLRRWRARLPGWTEVMAGTTVLTRARMMELFPDALIFTERRWGFEKSYGAYRSYPFDGRQPASCRCDRRRTCLSAFWGPGEAGRPVSPMSADTQPRRSAVPKEVDQFVFNHLAGAIHVEPPMRVALLAYHCNPFNPSEPWTAFQWARHLQGAVDLHVITHVRNRDGLERDLRLTCPITYVNTERLSRVLWYINTAVWGTTHVHAMGYLGSLDYIAFDIACRNNSAVMHALEGAHIIHRVSPKGLLLPTTCVPRDVPFVIGPINTGMRWPSGLRTSYQTWPEKLFIALRRAGIRVADVMTPSRVKHVVVANKVCFSSLPHQVQRRASVMFDSAVAIDEVDDTVPRTASNDEFRLLFAGRLVPLKGVALVLEAMASCRNTALRLRVAGDGPQRNALETLAASLGLEDRVDFLGHLPRDALNQEYATADAFVFPSMRESGGNVVLEAMLHELPQIVVAHGGPAELVDSQSGIRLSPTSRDALVWQLREGIETLSADVEYSRRLGTRARTIVLAHHTWNRRVADMLQCYKAAREMLKAARGHSRAHAGCSANDAS